MMAKREHSRNIVPLFIETLKEAGVLDETQTKPWTTRTTKKLSQLLEREPEMLDIFLKEIPRLKKPRLDRITVTVGPGLEPALWVGINFANTPLPLRCTTQNDCPLKMIFVMQLSTANYS